MTRWGVGPKVIVSTLAYSILVWAVSRLFPTAVVFAEHGPMEHVRTGIGIVLIALGVPFWSNRRRDL